MSDAQKAAIITALTTIISSFTTYLAAKHFIPETLAAELAGAIVVLLVAGASAWYNERKAKDREVIAVNAGIEVSNAQPGQITPPIPPALVPAVIKETVKAADTSLAQKSGN